MRPALALALIAALSAAACARRVPTAAAPAPHPDVTAPSRAAFGDHMEKYQGRPLADMIAAYGPPNSKRPSSDGGSIAVWSRKGEAMVDGKPLPQDCDVTAFVDASGTVSGIFAGGNILYCEKTFVPPKRTALPEGDPFAPPAVSPLTNPPPDLLLRPGSQQPVATPAF